MRAVSYTHLNILILGENGTGKDLVARSLRHYSPRRESPFITIDLGSIPETLFEMCIRDSFIGEALVDRVDEPAAIEADAKA